LYHAKTKIAPKRTTPPIAPPAIAPTLREDPEEDEARVAEVSVGATTVDALWLGRALVAVAIGVAEVGVVLVEAEVVGPKVIALVGTNKLLSAAFVHREVLIIPRGNTRNRWQLSPALQLAFNRCASQGSTITMICPGVRLVTVNPGKTYCSYVNVEVVIVKLSTTEF
jgi:hypothetical protein